MRVRIPYPVCSGGRPRQRRCRARCVAAAALAMLFVPGPAALARESAAAAGCEMLTDLDAAALERYQFESDPRGWEPLPADAAYLIGDIEIVQQNVFEAPDNAFERAANRYRWLTREAAIRQVLTFGNGDRVDGRLLRENERILRSKNYLYDARVIPRRVCDDRLDVFVVSRDVWTLDPRLDLSRSGGDNDFGFGLSDGNVAGTGKALAIGFDRDNERRGVSIAYHDPNVLGTRFAMDLEVIDNDDGEYHEFGFGWPFYALDVRRAFGIDAREYRREEGLYFLDDKLWEYQADSTDIDLFLGLSGGLRNGIVNRLRVGVGYEEHRFEFPAGFHERFPGTAPEDRRRVFPYVAFQRIEANYDTRVNLDRVQRTEDLALGGELEALFGWSGSTTGGDREELVVRASYEDAHWLGERQLARYRVQLSGYYDLEAGRTEELLAEATVAYRLQQSESWSLLIRGALAWAHNLPVDRQVLLGGDEGLRGYPNRYQIGDRRAVLTIEERYYSRIYPFEMFRLGGAVFLDVGRAWFDGDVPDWVPDERDAGHFGVLTNAGFGLRVESTRTRRDRILHLDVAFPLRDGPGTRSAEVTLSAKQAL